MQEPPRREPLSRRASTLRNLTFAALLVLVGFIVIVGIASGSDDPAPTPVNPPIVPSNSATAPEQATLLVPPKEAEYVDAVRAAVPEEDLADYDDLSILNTGRGVCGQQPRLESGQVDEEEFSDLGDPSSVDGFIEDPPDRAAQLAVKHLCPKYLPVLKRAKGGFGEGPQTVGKDVKPGRYKTTGRVTDCYWERSTRGGKTLANDFITNAPGGVTVTIVAADGGFTSQGCGDWVRLS